MIDPELGENIVDLGMVRTITVDGDRVTVDVALTVAACPLRTQIEKDVRGLVESLDWVAALEIRIATMDAAERAAVMARARWKAREDAPETSIPATTRVLAIASGKGGVGKSSITVNLAVALARRGLTVGILDADIWGFSVPRLLGMEGEVEARKGKMVPLEKTVGSGLVRVLSMGFLADEEQAIMWRGLILNRAVQQFLQDAHWGDLDYLLIDLPPGTGDVQMGLARLLPRTEMLVVTTPPLAAQKVAARAADMARKGYLRVAGVIENMSDFTCEHGTTYALFGSGGRDPSGPRARRPARRLHTPPPRSGRRRRRGPARRSWRRPPRRSLRRTGPRRGGGGCAAARDVVLLGTPHRPGEGRRGQRRCGVRGIGRPRATEPGSAGPGPGRCRGPAAASAAAAGGWRPWRVPASARRPRPIRGRCPA